VDVFQHSITTGHIHTHSLDNYNRQPAPYSDVTSGCMDSGMDFYRLLVKK